MDKILIVDDEIEICSAAKQALSSYKVDTASNVEEAISRLEDNFYLVVFTDMEMPVKKDGEKEQYAGKIVVDICCKRLIPCFVVTAGDHHHHHHDRTILYGTFPEFPELLEIECFHKKKNKDALWNEVWNVVSGKEKEILDARRRFIKYTRR